MSHVHGARIYENPYSGLDESAITSNVLDFRDAFDGSLSWYTTSGTSSVFTLQVSGDQGPAASVVEASWSDWTVVPLASGASAMEPPLSYPWARIVRTCSGASMHFDFNKFLG